MNIGPFVSAAGLSLCLCACGHKSKSAPIPKNSISKQNPTENTVPTPRNLTDADCNNEHRFASVDGKSCVDFPAIHTVPGFESASFLDGDFEKRLKDFEDYTRNYFATFGNEFEVAFQGDNSYGMVVFGERTIRAEITLSREGMSRVIGLRLSYKVRDGREVEPTFDVLVSFPEESLSFQWNMSPTQKEGPGHFERRLTTDSPAISSYLLSLQDFVTKPQHVERAFGREFDEIHATMRRDIETNGLPLDSNHKLFIRGLTFTPPTSRSGKVRIRSVDDGCFSETDGSNSDPEYLGCKDANCITRSEFNYQFIGNQLLISNNATPTPSGGSEQSFLYFHWYPSSESPPWNQ